VALETFNYPSLSEVLMRQIMEESYGPKQVQTFVTPANAPQVENLGQAQAKIRRRRSPDGQWGIWSGWLLSRNVEISRVNDEEVLEHCGLLAPKHPLTLGTTLDGRNFSIEGRAFEKINIITALKGMGKSHLGKVLILQLIEQGMACVIFDIYREYNRLPRLELDNIVHLSRHGTIVRSA